MATAALAYPGPRLAEPTKTRQPMNGADIQIEDGNFTRIHNAILDALCQVNMNGTEARLLFHLFRQTYGWQRLEYEASYQYMATAIGAKRLAVIRAMARLQKWHIIISTDNGNRQAKTWRFNKYTEQWTASIKKDTSIENDTSADIEIDTTASIEIDTQLKKEKKEDDDDSPKPPQQPEPKDSSDLLPAQERSAVVDAFKARFPTLLSPNDLPVLDEMQALSGATYELIVESFDRTLAQSMKKVDSGKRPIGAPASYSLSILRDLIAEDQRNLARQEAINGVLSTSVSAARQPGNRSGAYQNGPATGTKRRGDYTDDEAAALRAALYGTATA